MEKLKLFWKGPFSQWTRIDMYDYHTGLTFNCCEQFMMYKKAEMFGDKDAMNDIMATPDPRQQKAIGRQVKNFDKYKWEKSCRQIVEYANYLKFTQNPDLAAKLLSYDLDTTFVEASPFDAIWGIALEATDPRASNRETWLGTNWLGEAITNVRDRIITDSHYWKNEIKG